MLDCPFYDKGCIIKPQTSIPEFKMIHDCSGKLSKCSFFIKEKLKQIKTETPIKIVVKQVSNPYLVKADGLVYPANTLLKVDDPILIKMTSGQIQNKCDILYDKNPKLGYSYPIKVESDWILKQKFIFNAIVSVESRLVNESDVASAMKKTLITADQMGLQNLVIIPFDNGTHDISLIAQTQLSAVYTLGLKHIFTNLKSIYFCMEDEESEQTFVEYYNRIFGSNNESTDTENITSNS